MKTLALFTAAVSTLLLSGCTQGTDQKPHLDAAKIGAAIGAWWEKPRTQAIVGQIEDTAVQIGLNALGNKLDRDGLSGLAYGVRTLEGVHTSTAQIWQTADSFNAPDTAGGEIAAAVFEATQRGVPESVAKEAVARGLDKAVALAGAP